MKFGNERIDNIMNNDGIDLGISVPAAIADLVKNHAKQAMWSMVQYKEMQMLYSCALKAIKTKFEILSTEFNVKYKRNPISSIQTRLKRTESIIEKLVKNGYPITLTSVEKNLNDVAGIRVVCSYIDDIYIIADALTKQDDVRLVSEKDYIKFPKPNGYRSLHLIIEIPVFLSETKKMVKVEVQIRTIAMDFWASLEHQMKYKKSLPEQTEINEELRECADIIATTDARMLSLRRRIESAEDVSVSAEEQELISLMEKVRKFDIPIN